MLMSRGVSKVGDPKLRKLVLESILSKHFLYSDLLAWFASRTRMKKGQYTESNIDYALVGALLDLDGNSQALRHGRRKYFYYLHSLEGIRSMAMFSSSVNESKGPPIFVNGDLEEKGKDINSCINSSSAKSALKYQNEF